MTDFPLHVVMAWDSGRSKCLPWQNLTPAQQMALLRLFKYEPEEKPRPTIKQMIEDETNCPLPLCNNHAEWWFCQRDQIETESGCFWCDLQGGSQETSPALLWGHLTQTTSEERSRTETPSTGPDAALRPTHTDLMVSPEAIAEMWVPPHCGGTKRVQVGKELEEPIWAGCKGCPDCQEVTP